MTAREKKTVSPPLRKTPLRAYLKANYWFYIFLIPGIAFLIIFKYIPMGGVIIAFQDFNIVKGIAGSEWVGLEHFRYLFQSADFYRILRNSILISLYRLFWGFPVPILLALLMNEMRSQKYKRSMQTVLYLPHFISWVVVGMVYNMLSPSSGILNYFIQAMGGDPVAFLTNPNYFRSILVITDIWKGAGWGTIVYMAAISGIDPSLYEAAIIDGATRLQRMRYVTLPCIAGTIVVMLIMRMGSILNNGFEQVYLMSNALVSEVSEIFETYTYQVGLREGRYSFASAVGIFQSIVGCLLLYITNFVSKRIGGGGLW
ncbi:MAG: ABC transporter permease [Oscillospiraceae bacterium]